MKSIRYYLVILSVFFWISCGNKHHKDENSIPKTTEISSTENSTFAMVIHGGAGNMNPDFMTDSLQTAYKEKLEEAIHQGYEILKDGGSSLDAVQASIRILEDSPQFNAGKGAVLNHLEKPELDAAIMEGKNLNAGAISGISHIKNPIDLARTVMEQSKHVMLSGEGAENFAKEQGFELIAENYFITENRLKAVRAAKAKDKLSYHEAALNSDKFGTVGAVALDQSGNLAAGTSTGGLNNKQYGRIGDSPIIGAGTYANNKTCAISCTGEGEYFIRGNVAYDVSALMEYAGLSLAEATQKVIHEKQPKLGGTGGLIALDTQGNISMPFNTSGMFRAYKKENGEMEIKIFK